MQIINIAAIDNTIAELLEDDMVRPQVRLEQGLHCPAQITLQRRSTSYIFELGHGFWRLVGISVYGNWEGVHGAGCDASGYKVHGSTAQGFDIMLAEENAR